MSAAEGNRPDASAEAFLSNLFPAPIRKQGRLTKLGYKSGKWQDRNFDLQAHFLVYHGAWVVAKGQINISGASVQRVGLEEKIDPLSTTLLSLHGTALGHNYAIKLKAKYDSPPNYSRVFYLAAQNEADRNEWIDALNTNITLLEAGPRASICTTLTGVISTVSTAQLPVASSSPTVKKAITSGSSAAPVVPAPSSLPAEAPQPELIRDTSELIRQLKLQHPDIHATKTEESEQIRLREIIGMLIPGTSGFALTEIIPGGLADNEGLEPFRYIIIEYEGHMVGINGEVEQSLFIDKKRQVFADKGQLDLVLLDITDNSYKKVSLKATGSHEERVSMSLGIAFSFVCRSEEKDELFVEGAKKTANNEYVADDKHSLYTTDTSLEAKDVYVKAIPASNRVVSGYEKADDSFYWVPLYDYVGSPGFLVEAWSKIGSSTTVWCKKTGLYPLPPR